MIDGNAEGKQYWIAHTNETFISRSPKTQGSLCKSGAKVIKARYCGGSGRIGVFWT